MADTTILTEAEQAQLILLLAELYKLDENYWPEGTKPDLPEGWVVENDGVYRGVIPSGYVMTLQMGTLRVKTYMPSHTFHNLGGKRRDYDVMGQKIPSLGPLEDFTSRLYWTLSMQSIHDLPDSMTPYVFSLERVEKEVITQTTSKWSWRRFKTIHTETSEIETKYIEIKDGLTREGAWWTYLRAQLPTLEDIVKVYASERVKAEKILQEQYKKSDAEYKEKQALETAMRDAPINAGFEVDLDTNNK